MAEEMQEEIISEGAEYSAKSEFSKPRIVEKSVIFCLEARGREMKAGYFNTKIDKHGEPHRIWIEDSRKVFISRVEALRGLLSPEIKRNENIKKELKKLDDETNKVFESCCYEEMYTKKNNEQHLIWIKSDRKFIPEIDDPVVIIDPLFPNKGSFKKGGWNLKTNSYWNDLIKIYDKIFAKLNDLAFDLNYFKSGISF